MGMMVADRLLSAMAAVCDSALAWVDADEAKAVSSEGRTAEEWAEGGRMRREAEASLAAATERLRVVTREVA